MTELARIGISLESELLKEFDRLIAEEGYPTRSEAIKLLINSALVKKRWQKSNNQVAGAIIFIYNHHKRQLVNKMMDVQHDFNKLIISVQHIHLDHNNCMETVVVSGKVKDILSLVTSVKTIKGIKHSDLIMTTAG
ncbi:MAG: nickel-responsive transcriptional regulator NikR [Planctomycetota bacterium]|nr:nickel-responsive transcriptional regulator NikR [Planctomycetota bacterium]MDI6787067.1 nickel-responsive transcriptional regulator NikR [Planctomycetota bacterium]